ncbi:GlsB/YeaQ/YmgE family stress response membrane protein [Anaerococcus rubeinfantis]|uniref:GlsB/YeaQ/YmgE family stress response membrane protein n=1 Tax=Anaerococcus rubeinfantis TaxID=1720199 RepID=UPI00073ED733|nr:GlsB/YeaQ/YmgE family stress response membrane protein [Anaerococcus rubeinfantis]
MISSIIIGALCGWIASMIMKTDAQMGAIANIVVGIIGGAIGSWILGIVNINVSGFIGSLISGILGSVILIYVYNLITKKNK